MMARLIGHNAASATINIEVRFFNSLVRHNEGGKGITRQFEVPLDLTS